MAYTAAQIDAIREKLRSLPEIDDNRRELNKQQAVQRMADEVGALRARGYSLQQNVDLLASDGVQISAHSLKTYLTKAKSTSRQKHRRKDQSKAEKPPEQSLAQEKSPTTARSSGKPATTPPRQPDRNEAAATRSSSFTPRPDTDDI